MGHADMPYRPSTPAQPPDMPYRPSTPAQPPVTPYRQSRAVAVLSVVLGTLLAVWLVGGYLLYTYADDLIDLPSPSPSATP